MKIYVTGANGYIGKALVERGCLPFCSDITRPFDIEREIKEKKPDIVLHLAAKSNPEWCEKIENRSAVNNVNVRGVYNVFFRASANQIPCVLLSTGQIWKGGFWEMFGHRENDKKTPPVNVYGISKLAAESVAQMFTEQGAKIVRTSSVFDAKHLAQKIDLLKDSRFYLYEPTFIRRSFIYLGDLADLLLDYCGRISSMPDTLHLAGSEIVSHYEFMRELARRYGFDIGRIKARRNEEEGYVPRPHNAGLDTRLAQSLGFRIPSYVDGIKRMKNEG